MTQVQEPVSQAQESQLPVSQTPRVQVRPLLLIVLLALLVPVGLAFAADAALGTTPIIAIVVSAICIPLATVLVINRTLREMKALIAVVAPEETPAEAPDVDAQTNSTKGNSTEESNTEESSTEGDSADGAGGGEE